MTFYESHPQLQALLLTAFENGVTVMCSTADAGQQGPRVYPAGWTDRIISISACNRHFTPAEYTDHRATYFLPGEHVSAASLSYAEAERTISGSSVATAMASGLASLILSCRNYARLESGHARPTGGHRRETIQNVLERMLETRSGKSVMPDRVFNEENALAAAAQGNETPLDDGQRRRADDSTWRIWIKEYFGPLMM
jgi:hypothetical protein